MGRFQHRAEALAAPSVLALAVFCAPALAAPPQVNAPHSASVGSAAAAPNAGQFTNPVFVTPFQQNIYVSIADGASGGSDNGNVSPGTQTILAPQNHKLLIQTVCAYRGGSFAATTAQVFINSSVQGAFSALALPPIVGVSGISYVGSCFTGNFYADAGTRILANVFRNGTSGSESTTVVVSGHWVD